MLKKETLLGAKPYVIEFPHVIICIAPRTMRTINTFLIVPHLEKEKRLTKNNFLVSSQLDKHTFFSRECRTWVEPVS